MKLIPIEGNPFSDNPVEQAIAFEGLTGSAAHVARSIYQQESGSGKNTTTSNAGARGGMQVIPATFERMADKGWNIDNPVDNARAGVRYIKRLGELAGGDPALTAAGYYGGEGAIEKARRGIAVSDPRNPKAPNTLQYGQQVASRIPEVRLVPVDFDPFAEERLNAGPKLVPVNFDPFATTTKQEYDPADGISPIENFRVGWGKGMADLGHGLMQTWDKGAQFLESIVPGGESISRATGSKTAREIEESSRQAAIERERLDAPLMNNTAGKWGHISGQITTGLVASPILPGGAVGGGMAFGAATPTTEEGYGDTIKNIAIGGIAGYAGDKVLKGVSRLIQPKVNPNVRKLLDEGVTPTPGQILGGNMAKLEARSTSLPIIGNAIASAQGRAGEQVRTAAFNRALTPIGEKLPKGVDGHDAVAYVERQLGKAYDDLLPTLTTQADDTFRADIAKLRSMVDESVIDPKYTAHFEKVLQNRVLNKFQGQQAMTGETVKEVESFLGQQIRNLAKNNDGDARTLGTAFSEVQSNIRDLLARTNPEKATELRAINSGWANFKRVQRAGGSLDGNGEFTVAQLQNAVKAMSGGGNKSQFARGNALMQDLSGAAKDVLGSKVPDSGTAGRLMSPGGLGTIGAGIGGYINPAVPISLIGGAGLYSPTAQKLIAGLLTKRPVGAGLLAERVSVAAPYAGLLSAGGTLEFARSRISKFISLRSHLIGNLSTFLRI